MFGFLKPSTPIREWRQSYARICQYQRELFGLTSLPFLSYEATFLYQLLIDERLTAALPENSRTCCRLRRISQADERRDEEAATLVASFGMLLAGIKLQDDVRDSNRWHNRLLWRKFRRPTEQAHGILTDRSPEVAHGIANALLRHAKLEQSGRHLDIREYAGPTGSGFAAVFRAVASAIMSDPDPQWESQFAEYGRHLGHAIIAWDCAQDFSKDRFQGHFNPLRTPADVARSFDYCRLELARLGWALRLSSASRQVVESVSARVQRRAERGLHADNVRRMERWGLLRDRSSAYARCDACEVCGALDCCEAVECLNCASGGCDSCWPCHTESERQPSGNLTVKDPSPSGLESTHVGKLAVTDGALSPSGFVVIQGERIPARSDGGLLLEDNLPVRVTSGDAFGVNVRSAVDE